MSGQPWARPGRISPGRTCDRCGDFAPQFPSPVALCGKCLTAVADDPRWHPGGLEFERIRAEKLRAWGKTAARMNEAMRRREKGL